MNLIFDDLGKGPAILFLHAFPLTRKMWTPQVAEISAAGFRSIIPDLPGFGQSPAFAGEPTMDEMAFEVEKLINHLKLRKFILCGLSMGGYAAFSLLRRIPEKLAALALCDTTHLPDTVEKQKSRFQLIDKIEAKGNAVLIEEMLPNLIAESSAENDALVGFLKKQLSAVKPESAIAALRAMAHRRDSTDLLAKIDVPTALIFGQEDKITPPQTAHTLQSEITGSELFEITGAGHLSNLEQPQLFNRALIDFCRKVSFQ